jgi:hypothetical protein
VEIGAASRSNSISITPSDVSSITWGFDDAAHKGELKKKIDRIRVFTFRKDISRLQ